MKKFTKYLGAVLLGVSIISLSGCGNEKALEETQTAVESYNSAAEIFNEKISSYNEAAQAVIDANKELQDTIDSAQNVIDAGETPFDEKTLEELKSSLSEAVEEKEADPKLIDEYEAIEVDQDSKKEELDELKAQVTEDIETMDAYEIPESPEIPDYSKTISELADEQKAYEDSVTGLKQVTAPSDDFVIERLQTIKTITDIGAVTEETDVNNLLNKQGGYIGCVYFADSRVDRSELYIEDGKDSAVDVGVEGGGGVEIYPDVAGAESRNEYLASFDGAGMLSPGSHYVVGTLVIRTADQLTATQQKELTDAITQALIKVK